MSKTDECIPCGKASSSLKGRELEAAAKKLPQGWAVVQDHHLEREFEFKDFRGALDFTNLVGELAEKLGHHPDIFLTWGKVKISIWTHKVNGLTEGDFTLAGKIAGLKQPGQDG